MLDHLRLLLTALIALPLAGCSLLGPLTTGATGGFAPGSVPTEQRMLHFPTQGLPLTGNATTVYFSQEQIPFIETDSDEDLPLALGLVHAHLRLAQMETLRAVSQGRLGELAGPLPMVTNLDHALRILDFGKAVPAMLSAMDPETHDWLARFVQGVNFYKEHAQALSPELELLGVADKPWTMADVLTVARLASTDVNWLFWTSQLMHWNDPEREVLWQRIRELGLTALPSYAPGDAAPLTDQLLTTTSGSNSWVVSGAKTASGAALIASDPHVGLRLPNFWLLTAFKSPTYNVVGFCLPGLPVVVEGRNQDIAWGGTNMMALSSSLYDVTALDPATFELREEQIHRRFWLPATREVRETPYGPLISDIPFFKDAGLPPTALTWRGHRPSDEIKAFLRVDRAKNFAEFRAAFATYAISGQNFLYADRQGNIGLVPAVAFDPAAGRTALNVLGDPAKPEQRWTRELTPTELPHAYNPAEGFLGSANNPPFTSDPPLSIRAADRDRIRRILDLLAERSSRGPLTLTDMEEMQQDVYQQSAHELAQLLATRADQGSLSSQAREVLARIAAWDGQYLTSSEGAAAFEITVGFAAKSYYGKRYDANVAESLLGSRAFYVLFTEDLAAHGDEIDLPGALDQAGAVLAEHPSWGDLHTLTLSHALGNTPVVGSLFRFGEVPVNGGISTIHKSAHDVTTGPHAVRYGASARHISDMSDEDANYFSLVGGQDGYLGSANYLDMFELWQRGDYVQVPLNPATAAATFPYVLPLLK